MLLPRKTQRSNAETRSAKETARGGSLSQDFSHGLSVRKTSSELSFSYSVSHMRDIERLVVDSEGTRPGKRFMSLGLEGERKRGSPHSRTAVAWGNQAKICYHSELWLLKRKRFSLFFVSLTLLLFRIQPEMLNSQVWVEFTHPAFWSTPRNQAEDIVVRLKDTSGYNISGEEHLQKTSQELQLFLYARWVNIHPGKMDLFAKLCGSLLVLCAALVYGQEGKFLFF